MKENSNRTPRFFLDKEPSSIEDQEQIHQIKRVLRLNTGDTIIGIFQKQEFLLRIESFEKEKITLSALEVLPKRLVELPFHLRVCLPILKGEKNELVLQKCTELGANEFQFINFDHSVKQNLNWEHKIPRWRKIIREAVEQSERLAEPTIKPAIDFDDLKLQENEVGIAFVERITSSALSPPNPLDRGNSKFNGSLAPPVKEAGEVTLIFGPEGGFGTREKELLKQKGFQEQSLGARILRAETAIIVGVGLVTINP
ncbi:MAG: RsmE family RNA methyltransferase [Candidatus Caenarcaniphilales bacterium]|nr:RsmE family RNA methyltransferase [Candidatus Caenarcaniphilales bacterium]